MITLRPLQLVILLVLISLLTDHPKAQSIDCTTHWANVLQVSTDSAFYNEPRIAVSGDTVHLLWFGTDFFGTVSHDGIQYSHSFDAGASFGAQTTLSSFDTATSPGFISASGTNVCVAFEAVIDTFAGTVIMRSSDAGVSWQAAQRLLPNTTPLLLETAKDLIYLHYLNKRANQHGLLVSSDSGRTWTMRNSDMPALSSMHATPTKLHAVGVPGSDPKEVIYYTSENFGATWLFSEILSREDFTNSLFPKITGNGGKDLYVVWNDSGNILLRHSANNGLSWLPEAKISEQRGAVFPSIGANREFVSVVWDNDFGGISALRLRPSNDKAISFCPIDVPSTDSGAGGPSITIFGNLLHVAWSKQLGISGAIFYRQGVLIDNPNQGDRPPAAYALKQNYPNPFNGITHISFDLPTPARVTLTIYNLLGQTIATVLDEDRAAGRYSATFESTSMTSGLYVYELRTPGIIERKKMIVVK